jgi:opacity protein-like surface antigen
VLFGDPPIYCLFEEASLSGGRIQHRIRTIAAAAATVSVMLCLTGQAGAQTLARPQPLTQPQMLTGTADAPPAAWYVVGNFDRSGHDEIDGFVGFDDRRVLADEGAGGVGLGLTFSNAEADRTLNFTAPSTDLGGDSEDRFTFLVSGAYDWHTGTIVTPRFMAGVGVSYVDPNAVPTRLRQDGGAAGDMAPAMQVGIGADVSLSSALDLSAEYRASVRGGADPGSQQEPQVDQKFMIGAKLRF